MSLSLALNNALSGLNVNQQSLSILSQNIANANTKGYVRKVINQSAVYLDGNGAGVNIDSIGRKVDEYLLKSIRLQGAVVGKNSTLSDYADRTQLLLGKPGAANSLTSYFNDFFNSVQTLAQTPENSTLRVNVANNASSLTRQVSTLANSLQDLRLQTEGDISTAVNAVNADLRDLKALNTTITSDSLLGKNVGELLDKRDTILADISQYLDITTNVKSSGEINVFTGSGVSLLDDSVYQLSYVPQSSTASFIGNATLAPINVYRINDSGQVNGKPTQLVSGGTSSKVVSGITSGKLRGLLDMRDTQIPNMLTQLDQLTSKMRDEMNRVHNTGIGFPGANSYTGTRAINAGSFSLWSGSARIAVMDNAGRPIPSPYADETSGVRPLKLDLSKLDTGNGAGYPSMQGIIDEINQYYGPPQNKAVVGNLNNIRLVSDSRSLPGSPPQFSFDFDLENISGTKSSFFVTDVQVLDDTNAVMTPITQNVPQVALADTGTYITTPNSSTITVNTTAAHGFVDGQKIYLQPPGSTIDGIPSDQLGGFFTISNVTPTSFQIQTSTPATTGMSNDVTGLKATPSYREVAAGEYGRSKDQGIITTSLANNSGSAYYTVRASIAVDDGKGNLVTSQISYQIDNSQTDLLNKRYNIGGISGGGSIVAPNTNQSIARAILVDEDGNELPKINGKYTTQQNGFLKLVATNSSYSIGIDSLDSVEQGKPNTTPSVAGSDRGFSYFFELNNFFERFDNNGDTVTNSAINFKVQQRILDNPNLISLGVLKQSNPPSDTTKAPLYTYERSIGDNSIIQKLASISSTVIDFSAAGGLGQYSTTIGSYAGSIIGAASTNASAYKSDLKNADSLMTGYSDRSDSISGVNLDEELANTVVYQNAYTASTRVISVVSQLFDSLLNTFGR